VGDGVEKSEDGCGGGEDGNEGVMMVNFGAGSPWLLRASTELFTIADSAIM
jgi:hypothetical protein